MQIRNTTIELGSNKAIYIETGKLAKQAAGSATVRIGDTMILVTVCKGEVKNEGFFPLTVEYREKAYAVGKIPGGYLKREARPSDAETLIARMIDRPIRPLFPDKFNQEIQIVVTVLSADDQHDTESIAVTGASVALGLTGLPVNEQVAAVKVIKVGDEFIVNPTFEEMESSDLEMVVAGSASSIMMVEGGAFEISEEHMIKGIEVAHNAIKKMVEIQSKLIAEVNPTLIKFQAPVKNEDLFKAVENIVLKPLQEALNTPMVKSEHYPAMKKIKTEAQDKLQEAYPEQEALINEYFSEIEKREMRELILSQGKRIDGRKEDEIRPIYIETNLLPIVHGSALFQRGETQALVTCTLGGKSDEQRIDALKGNYSKNYFLHYNFPPYSVGETGRIGTPGRREIGHGNLAERSLEAILPTTDYFPYTIRIVSEILESNGSSSMASVCGGSLALMATGVPIKSAIAGIAMGLISDGKRVKVLSDITGTEDHLGDMDFKVTGTKDGITAFQMDIKIAGITSETMLKALEQAKKGRLHILSKMTEALSSPNDLSPNAPCISKKQINPSKIKDLIGPGGKMIRSIQEKSGVQLDISDQGEVTIMAPKKKNSEIAEKLINDLFAEIEVDKTYQGKVKNITNFGIFVEALPGKEGLVHISEIILKEGETLESSYSLGDPITVKCIGIDPKGRVKLSSKAVETSN